MTFRGSCRLHCQGDERRQTYTRQHDGTNKKTDIFFYQATWQKNLRRQSSSQSPPCEIQISRSFDCSQEPGTSSSPDTCRSSTHPHTLYLHFKYILIVSSYLGLGLTSRLFPSGFQSTILYAFLISLMWSTHSALSILHGVVKVTRLQITK
jgi:hypothetical protein